MKSALRAAAILSALLVCPITATAARHALLIGVSKYPGLDGFDLEAPRHDVRALRTVLHDKWSFPNGNIITLEDQAASKAGILRALDTLVAKSKPGDQVFLYFSGHGTSSYDPTAKSFGLDPTTGGLIPSDFRRGSVAQVLDRLIIARRDLRPRLEALDGKVEVFAVFDACYSGAAIKSIQGGLLAARELPFDALINPGEGGDDLGQPRLSGGREDYPYRTVVYLSASARSEKAFEITTRALESGIFSTVDGLPHGLLTNHLLRALTGLGDTDADGRITYRELHQFVYGAIMRQQTPQLLTGRDIQIARNPVFAAPNAPVPNTKPAVARSTKLTVRLLPEAASLADRLRAIDSIELIDKPSDLLVIRDKDRYLLAYTGGTVIDRFLDTESDVTRLVERIRREPDLRRLIEWKPSQAAFNLFVAAEPANRVAYSTGDELSFTISPEASAWPLLLNIDTSGYITVLHPLAAPQLCPAQSVCRTKPARVNPPTGTELIKAFAFKTRPPGIDQWIGKSFAPTTPEFRQFIAFIAANQPNAAQATLQVFTVDGR